MNSLIHQKKISISYTFCIYHYLVVRGKSFLVETETEEDEANVSGYDASNEGEFIRALKPGVQNKCGHPLCVTPANFLRWWGIASPAI